MNLHFQQKDRAFSRSQFLFVLCLALMAFELGSRFALNKTPARKTEIRHVNIIPAETTTPADTKNVKVPWPTNQERAWLEKTNSQLVTNAPRILATTPPRSPSGTPPGGGAMAPGIKAGGYDQHKVQGEPKQRVQHTNSPTVGNSSSAFAIRFALP